MDEKDALTLLRSTVPKFARSERLALVTLLTFELNPRLSQIVYKADPLFGREFDTALATIGNFSQQQKLAFAIELLQDQLSRDEVCGSGEFSNSNYQGEEYYSSDRPLLDEYNLDPYGYDTPAIDEEEED